MRRKWITAGELNAIMECDHVIVSYGDDTVADDIPVPHAPSILDGEPDGMSWSLLDGYSMQHGYRGPIMHDSEFIGAKLAEHILSHAGYYVAVPALWSPDGDRDGEFVGEGWAVARFCDHTWTAGMMYVHSEDVQAVSATRDVECETCDAKRGPVCPLKPWDINPDLHA